MIMIITSIFCVLMIIDIVHEKGSFYRFHTAAVVVVFVRRVAGRRRRRVTFGIGGDGAVFSLIIDRWRWPGKKIVGKWIEKERKWINLFTDGWASLAGCRFSWRAVVSDWNFVVYATDSGFCHRSSCRPRTVLYLASVVAAVWKEEQCVVLDYGFVH